MNGMSKGLNPIKEFDSGKHRYKTGLEGNRSKITGGFI